MNIIKKKYVFINSFNIVGNAFYCAFGWYFVSYKIILLKESIISIFGMLLIFIFLLTSVIKILFYTDKMRKD